MNDSKSKVKNVVTNLTLTKFFMTTLLFIFEIFINNNSLLIDEPLRLKLIGEIYREISNNKEKRTEYK